MRVRRRRAAIGMRIALAVALTAAILAGAPGAASPARAATSSPYFTALTASGATELQTARFDAVAAPLPDGQVLIAGGSSASSLLGSAELFDPATDTFTQLPEAGETELHTAREGAVAAPLPDGQVLIAGGWEAKATCRAQNCSTRPTTPSQHSLPPVAPSCRQPATALWRCRCRTGRY